MSRTAARLNRNVLCDLVSIILGVDDDNRVSAEIVDGKVATRRVKVSLMRVRSSLALLIRAKLSRRLESLDELQATLLSVPNINGTISISSTNETCFIRVELKMNNADTSGLLGLEGKLISLEIKIEESQLIRVLVNGVEQVGVIVGHP
jgi:hypothetical protein